MKEIQVTEKNEIKGGDKLKIIMNKKLLKNNKGFSLVELLIVIAIMGVLAVLAFNVFGGVLSNSKKKADDQQAQNIAKAVLTYCIDSGDWELAKAKDSAGAELNLKDKTGTVLVQLLTDEVVVDGVAYGPYVALKDAAEDATDEPNKSALAPQWNAANGGTNFGWAIVVDKSSQNVTCKPGKAEVAAHDAVLAVAATDDVIVQP